MLVRLIPIFNKDLSNSDCQETAELGFSKAKM